MDSTLTVHPRWRGEHQKGWQETSANDGSSPLARGTHHRQYRHRHRRRFIPAGAGNTPAISSSFRTLTVHPRWRGEHVEPKQCAVHLARFIPAGAGNTAGSAPSQRSEAVHPRWRGEHEVILPMALLIAGSSPLARGTPFVEPKQCAVHRFIPAGAGNTSRSRSRRLPSPVHPRWRGEHS